MGRCLSRTLCLGQVDSYWQILLRKMANDLRLVPRADGLQASGQMWNDVMGCEPWADAHTWIVTGQMVSADSFLD